VADPEFNNELDTGGGHVDRSAPGGARRVQTRRKAVWTTNRKVPTVDVIALHPTINECCASDVSRRGFNWRKTCPRICGVPCDVYLKYLGG
jgi:hypothetical protein